MTGRGWRSKGDKVVGRNPIKRGKKCDRPFTAPRQVTQTSTNRQKKTDPKQTEDSDVQVVTEDGQIQTVATVKSRLSHTHRMKGIYKLQGKQCQRQ
jgi:hypothetical protein